MAGAGRVDWNSRVRGTLAGVCAAQVLERLFRYGSKVGRITTGVCTHWYGTRIPGTGGHTLHRVQIRIDGLVFHGHGQNPGFDRKPRRIRFSTDCYGRSGNTGGIQLMSRAALKPQSPINLDVAPVHIVILHQVLNRMRDFVRLTDATGRNQSFHFCQRFRFHGSHQFRADESG